MPNNTFDSGEFSKVQRASMFFPDIRHLRISNSKNKNDIAFLVSYY